MRSSSLPFELAPQPPHSAPPRHTPPHPAPPRTTPSHPPHPHPQIITQVSDTETIFNSEKALDADPYVNGTGLIEDVLASIMLAQARGYFFRPFSLQRPVHSSGPQQSLPAAFLLALLLAF